MGNKCSYLKKTTKKSFQLDALQFPGSCIKLSLSLGLGREPAWHWRKGWWWHAEWGWFCSLDVANLRNKEVSLEKERAEEENQHLTQELGLFTRELDDISRENKALKEELHGTENTIAELGDNLKGSRLRIEELEGEKQSLCDAATERIQESDEQLQLQQRRHVRTSPMYWS